MIENLTWLLLRWWWLVTATALAAAIVAYVWVGGQPDYFVSKGTFVVQPRGLDESDQIRAIDALIDSEAVTATYVGIASSALIRDRAIAMLEIEGRDISGLEIIAEVVSGTTILELGVRGPDPELVQQMAVALGTTTIEYTSDLDDVYSLSTLDAPTAAGNPIRRSTGLIIAIASIAGFSVGVGVARGAEHLLPGWPAVKIRNIRDRTSTAFGKRYFKQRVREEISRSHSSDHLFSVGVLQVNRPGGPRAEADGPAPLTGTDLSVVAADIRSTLCDHDLLAHLGRGRFATILPGVGVDAAQDLVQDWKRMVTKSLLDRPLSGDTAITVGACTYDSSGFVGDQVAEQMVGDP